jgi:Trk K+ transport system NAD-binding subunit
MELAATAAGMTVRDFEVDDQLRVAAVRRRDRTLVPRGDFVLREGDLVVASAQRGVRSKIDRYLRPKDDR